MINKSIISLIFLLCFMHVYAKNLSFKEFDTTNFKTQLNLVKQETEKEYLNNTQSIDAKIIAVLNSFDANMYKSIKSDIYVTPITKTKFSVVRNVRRKQEYIKHYTRQIFAESNLAKKQEYFRKTAAIFNYLKGYDRRLSYQIKNDLLNRAKEIVQKAKNNDFKQAYNLAEALSKDFYRYVKLS